VDPVIKPKRRQRVHQKQQTDRKGVQQSFTRSLTNYRLCCSFERTVRKKFIIVNGPGEPFKAPSEKVVEETLGVIVWSNKEAPHSNQ
jgi:hypothetical protein